MPFVFLLAALAQPALAASERDLIDQRRAYLEARAALLAGKTKTYTSLAKQLTDYPLRGYLELEEISKRINQVKQRDIQDFLQRNADSPIAPRLRALYLFQLAERKHWKTFLAMYEPTDDDELRCHYLHARVSTGGMDQVIGDIRRTWLVPFEQHAACDAVFAAWIKAKHLTAEDVWERIRMSIGAGRSTIAQGLKRFLSKKDRALVDVWIKVYQDPGPALNDPLLKPDTAVTREIVRLGITRIARLDVDTAVSRWEQLQPRYTFDATAIAQMQRELAIQAAQRQHPRALEWLMALNSNDEQVAHWSSRLALIASDWPALRRVVDALPPDTQDNDQWLYWRSRALTEIGTAQDDPSYGGVAFGALDTLSTRRSYYGFLAADQLSRDYGFNHTNIAYEENELAAIRDLPGMRRAYELFFLDFVSDARKEWLLATARMNARKLQLAAVLAHHWGWHDRAILTAARGAEFDDLDLRFPMVYQDQVDSVSRRYDIDASWVYGIMRQESAFMQDARSSAGAMGLMQLMPATATLTARLIKSPLRNNLELYDVDRNIELGSAYLKQMADKHNGNQVLATAAYNAGPHRVKQWIPAANQPADVWIELIPFRETREYVKRVLTYATIFDDRLQGSPRRVTTRMPQIDSKTP
jgi:soluble lytic murein transglycosylase